MAQDPATPQKRPDATVTSTFVDVGLVSLYVLGCLAVLQLPLTRFTGVVLLPLLLFVPGYSLVTALYPARSTPEGGFGLVERLALSFGLSVTLLPIVALGLAVSGVGLTAVPLVSTLTTFSILGTLVGGLRRHQLLANHRFRLPLGSWYRRLTVSPATDSSVRLTAMHLLLAVAVVLSMVTLAGAMLFPISGESFSGLTVLTVGDNGSYVAGDYPHNLTDGSPQEFVTAVQNDEGEGETYTLVAQLQRINRTDGDVRVLNRSELLERHHSVPADETWYADHTITPDMNGDDLRLTYLLYRGPVPQVPTVDSAYRHAFLNVAVVANSSREE